MTFIISSNLPIPVTPFVGREHEIAEIASLLQQPTCRLLTLVGLGGIGKTRLALEVVTSSTADFADGICYISFEGLNWTADYCSILAAALKLPSYPRLNGLDQVHTYLRDKRILLFLDNVETLENNTSWISQLLKNLPSLKILATSREALKLQEEWLYPVWGLTFPAELPQFASLVSYDAVSLFVGCAGRADKDFLLEQEAANVIRICQIVGGLPLAIELAATWLKVLPCVEIAKELSEGTEFLNYPSVMPRNLPERHRSMNTIIDRTWDQLTPDEQTCLTKLTIFGGEFTREAAEAVADADLPTIASLVDHVMLRKAARFSLHELIRHYASQHLTNEMRLTIGDKHSLYYLTLLATHGSDLKTSAQVAAMDILETEFSNICAAWLHAVIHQHTELLYAAVEGLTLFCMIRGRANIGENLLKQAQEVMLWDTLAQRKLFAYWIFIQEWHELYRERLSLQKQIEQLLALSQRTGEPTEIAFAMKTYGHFVLHQQDYLTARRYFEESLKLYTEVDDIYAMGQVNRLIGHCFLFVGQAETALPWYVRSRNLAQETGDRLTQAAALMGMGNVASECNRHTDASTYYEQAYQIQRELCNWNRLAFSAYNLAQFAIQAGDFSKAIAFAQEAHDIARRTGHSAHEARIERLLARISYQQNSVRSGATMLTGRELEVLRLMALGLPNREIAEQLVIVVGTVKTHIHSIYGKLEVANRIQAVSRAQQLKLI
jgi:predicted ATPase/DNA-binding CsgD family transcriptional regulator